MLTTLHTDFRAVFSLRLSFIAGLGAFAAMCAKASEPASPSEIELEEATLQAEAPVEFGGYLETNAATTTRLPVPVNEMPVSVQVVPRRVIEDQAAQGLEDVYKNISGVFESGNTLNAQSEVLPVIRGFEAPVVLRNGMRATTVGSVDLANIETVEVLKGPASIVFGALEPGGVLNFTTKKPLETPHYRIDQEFGSYDHFRTEVDATGPIDEAGRFLYRINAAYTDTESFRDEIEVERYIVAPSLTWRPTDRTEVTFDFTYTKEEQPLDSGIPLGGDGEPLVDDDTFFGDPDLDGRTLEDWFAGYELEHEFNDVFTFRNRFQYHLSEPRNESIRHRGVAGPPGAEELRLRYQNEDRTDEEFQFVGDLIAEFDTGGAGHVALLGLEYIHQETEFDRFRQNLPNVPISNDPNVNFTPPGTPLAPNSRDQVEWIALYAQDQISLLENGRLKLLLGGRYDDVETEDELDGQRSSENEFSGRAGALFQWTDWAAPYVSVSQSFRPQSPGTQDQAGNVLDPETGLQYEAGVKFRFFEDRLQATLSAYQIDKEDVSVFDQQFFVDTGGIAFLPGVDQRSRGVELDVSGQVTERLSLIANYAYTDTEETGNDGDPGREGVRLGNVPLHAARVWLAYDFLPGDVLEGLGFGVGGRYQSDKLAQFDESIQFDGAFVADAALWYRHELSGGQRLTARLNLKNVFDEEYVSRASTQDIAHPGAPFSAIASIGIEF